MNYYKKYLVLAVLGALIIGAAFYLFLNNYLDRQEILVAAKDINKGEKVEEDDLCFKQYYKNSLPESYLVSKKEVVGNIININRKKDDYISKSMFTEDLNIDIMDNLSEGEVLIAINVQYPEPLLGKLRIGRCISIVSTEKDKDLIDYDYHSINSYSKYEKLPESVSGDSNTGNIQEDEDGNTYEDINAKESSEAYINGNRELGYEELYEGSDYLDSRSFQLSEDILLVDGQLIVRNLEIISIEEYTSTSTSMLISEGGNSVSIYIKCNVKKAPIIARLTRDNKYKIIIESL